MDNSKLRDQAVEAIALWLNSEGWAFDTISCQFWQHAWVKAVREQERTNQATEG